jgi:hypothetical protein
MYTRPEVIRVLNKAAIRLVNKNTFFLFIALLQIIYVHTEADKKKIKM